MILQIRFYCIISVKLYQQIFFAGPTKFELSQKKEFVRRTNILLREQKMFVGLYQ